MLFCVKSLKKGTVLNKNIYLITLSNISFANKGILIPIKQKE